MKQFAYTPRKRLIASAVLLALSGSMVAQAATPAQDTSGAASDSSANQTAAAKKKDKPDVKDAANLQAVTVKGIIASMEQSVNIKRFSNGIVDGIVAEDIGKFPDTNLAEALQRIPGVSIDRVNGEGARVTVRGIGPQFNLVLLNGRLMPTANINGTSASTDRSFDFAQLSATAVSEVDVYKTGDAATPPGGMGATIDVVTARPFNNPGTHGALTVQGVYDTSNNHLPSSLQYGSNTTPRINGIFSTTSADGQFGFGINASYEKRTFGANVASTGGWRSFKGDENNWGTIPQPGTPGSENITNRPGPNDVYSVPQSLAYDVNGNQSTRLNGQVVLQYKPTDNLVTTLDYTYSEYKIQHRYNELSAWFNFGPSKSVWTNGPVAAPLVYSEILNAPADVAMAGGQDASKETLHSVGFNTKWKVSDKLKFSLDAHHSVAENGADSPYGNSAVLGTAAFIRGNTTANFTGKFPILTVEYLPTGTQLDPSQMLVTGSSFRNSYMRSTVDQLQLNGNYTLPDDSELNFGVASTDVKNRSAFSNVQLDTWGGATSTADYPNSVWHPDNMGQYFNQFFGNNNAAFTDAFYTFNFNQVRSLAEQAWKNAGNTGNPYLASPVYTTDRRTQEKSKSAFLSWDQTYFPWNKPLRVTAGVRYEKTDVNSSALVPQATAISWGSNNEFTVLESGSGFTQLKGSYNYFLPAFNVSLDVTDDMKVRAAYSETIGRPNWGDIQGGQTIDTLVRVNGGTGSQGNPGLKPLLSHNIDLSWAWYYSKGSYVSVDFFRKNIDNYVGTQQVVQTPFNLPTPVGGTYWNGAISNGGCAATDTGCIRQYIFNNYAGSPGVNVTGTDTTGALTGTIVGQPGDPLTPFRITTPANQKSASLYGWEFSAQQMLWDTGFGVAANYTIVRSPLTYDNKQLGQQFALVGLSDSANFVGFYEKGPWQLRAAYNWRGQFLASLFDSTGPNPIYTAPYGQWDLSASYDINKSLSVTLDAINVTNSTQYLYSRNIHQLEYATQTGARYMFGVRYKFN